MLPNIKSIFSIKSIKQLELMTDAELEEYGNELKSLASEAIQMAIAVNEESGKRIVNSMKSRKLS